MAIYKLKDICLKIGSGATPKGGKEHIVMKGFRLLEVKMYLILHFHMTD